jgi:SpoVK/Ycf46/Vps4 family AAA+-type ATPase
MQQLEQADFEKSQKVAEMISGIPDIASPAVRSILIDNLFSDGARYHREAAADKFKKIGFKLTASEINDIIYHRFNNQALMLLINTSESKEIFAKILSVHFESWDVLYEIQTRFLGLKIKFTYAEYTSMLSRYSRLDIEGIASYSLMESIVEDFNLTIVADEEVERNSQHFFNRIEKIEKAHNENKKLAYKMRKQFLMR